MPVYRTTCKIGACEPFCGLEVEVRDGRMVDVRPDPQHPITTGYACLKGMHVQDYQNDPDRLLYPVRRRRIPPPSESVESLRLADSPLWKRGVRGDFGGGSVGQIPLNPPFSKGEAQRIQPLADSSTLSHEAVRHGEAAEWERIEWQTATREIGQKLRAICDAHGPRAIATYWGNSSDSTTINLVNNFCQVFGSPNSFNVLSLEYTDRGAVAQRVLGNENLTLQPDAARAKFALLLGTNPLVTNGMTLLQRRPRIASDFKAIQRGGGKVVVVDPRRTETARVADEHLAIRPGTDLFLLVAMIRRILDTTRYNQAFVQRHVVGFDAWQRLVEQVDPDRVAEVTGIDRARIERLADQFAAADGAFATTRVGVQANHNTTLTEWAVLTLNAITGNIDRPGGLYFNPGFFDVPGLIEQFTKRRNPAPSRIGGYPQIFGGPPASTFADDVLSDDPERIRALVVVAGNPVITFPHTAKVEAALRRLELLVCVDLYVSDTAAFAHYVLPATTMYERGGIHFLTSTFEPYPFVEWRPKVVEPRGEARGEWDIFKDLSRAAGVPFLNDPVLDKVARVLDGVGIGFDEDWLYRFLLLGKTRLGRLKRLSHGVKRDDIRWGDFLAGGLRTPDKKIHLAPADLVEALPAALDAPLLPSQEFPFLLISGARRSLGYNSWTHNIPAFMEKMQGNWATMNPADAARIGVAGGERVRVTSAVGSVEIEVMLSAEVREGVIAIHQFWGHNYDSGTRTSRSHPGVNVNLLHDDRVRDRFCGMPVFNGTPCRVERIA